VPIFYDRGPDNLPREWVRRMKQCLRRLAPVFNTNRMVAQYATSLYVPANARSRALGGNALAPAATLAHGKVRLRDGWSGVRVVATDSGSKGPFKVGDNIHVEALIELGALSPGELRAELLSGPINSEGAVDIMTTTPMTHSREVSPGQHLFTAELACERSGRYGFALRVLPSLPNMAHAFEPGLIRWN
jgi:starch phosphorylase